MKRHNKYSLQYNELIDSYKSMGISFIEKFDFINEISIQMSHRVFEYIVETKNIEDSLIFLNIINLEKTSSQTSYIDFCIELTKSNHKDAGYYSEKIKSKWALGFFHQCLSCYYMEQGDAEKSDYHFDESVIATETLDNLEKDYGYEALCSFCYNNNRHDRIMAFCNRIEDLNIKISVICRFINSKVCYGEKLNINILSRYIDPIILHRFLNDQSSQ